MNPRARAIAPLVALATAAIGGAGCGSGSASCADAALTSAGFTLIDDMERVPNVISWPPPVGQPGAWWTATDCTALDRIAPPPYEIDPDGWSYDVLPEPHETFLGITSQRTARLRTVAPLSGIWGASAGLSFIRETFLERDGGVPGIMDPGSPCRHLGALDFVGMFVDLTAYSGVTFWAMADPKGLRRLKVKLRDFQSDPRGGLCNEADPGGDAGCYNDFQTTIILDGAFARYTVNFSSLAQDRYWGGLAASGVVDLKRVYSLIFEIDLPACTAASDEMCVGGTSSSFTFDFRIDDLYFLNR